MSLGHGGHVEAVSVDFWDGPLWSETDGQPLRRTRRKQNHHPFNAPSLHPHTHLLQRAGGPHQFVDHVDGDPHEGGEADEVAHRDAPVWVLVVEQRQVGHLQEEADDDKLRNGWEGGIKALMLVSKSPMHPSHVSITRQTQRSDIPDLEMEAKTRSDV